MQKLSIISVLLLIFFVFSVNAFALRCGNETINIGDIKNEVRLRCGEPIDKEEIGYIDRVQPDSTKIRVMKIEEWIISVSQYGTVYYYSLIFEGNVLKEIKDAGHQ